MNLRAYFAELIGTFMLTLVVSVSLLVDLPIPTPPLAAITLGLFVYTIGGISGAHLNPAVTVGLATVKKIKIPDAVAYIVFQIVGALLAMLVANYMTGSATELVAANDATTGLAEAIGAFVLIFGVSSVVHKKVGDAASGLTIGGSLGIGVIVASAASNGVLNPAVAIGIGSISAMYILAPVVGTVIGAWVYKLLASK